MLKPVARLQPEMKECLITILSNAVSNKMVILILKLSFSFLRCVFSMHMQKVKGRCCMMSTWLSGSCYFACEYAGRAQCFFFSSVQRQLHCLCDKALHSEVHTDQLLKLLFTLITEENNFQKEETCHS